MWNFRISLLSETYWKTNSILHPIHTEKLIDDEKPAKRSLPRFVQFHFLFLSISATCFKRDRLRSNKTREGKRTKKERTLRKRRPQALRPTRRKFFATKSEHVATCVAFFLSFCTQKEPRAIPVTQSVTAIDRFSTTKFCPRLGKRSLENHINFVYMRSMNKTLAGSERWDIDNNC